MRQRSKPARALGLALLLMAAGAPFAGAAQEMPAATPQAQPRIVPPAPNPAPAPRHDPADDIRRISVAEAHKAVLEGKATIVDVRGREEFAAQHVTGALNLSVVEVTARAAELSKDNLIITYCT